MLELAEEEGDVSEGEELTVIEVIQKLEEAWMNEQFAPDLLPCQREVVECVFDQLHGMEGNLARARKGDFKIGIHRMEIDRIRYMVSSYLRLRLKKVEKFAVFLQETKLLDDPDRLTDEERAYAKQYIANIDQHMETVGLRLMPPNLRTLEPTMAAIHPDLDRYVFFKVKRSTEGVMVEEETSEAREEILDLEEDDQHVMRYRPIAGLVTDGAVQLI